MVKLFGKSLLQRRTCIPGMLTGLLLMLAACGGGGSGGGASTDPGSLVIVEDGYILGARVVDGAGMEATELGDGMYRFPEGYRNPVMPVTVYTRNTIVGGVATGAISTFHKLDADNNYDAGMDVPYNASFAVQYVPNPLVIHINPITALVPASGNVPAGGIGGVGKALIESVQSSGLPGVDDAGSRDVRRLATQIVAIAESAVLLGASPDDVVALVDAIGEVSISNGSVNLLQGFGTAIQTVLTNSSAVGIMFFGKTDPGTSSAVVYTSAAAALADYADAIQTATVESAVNVNKNFEAIISALQNVALADADYKSAFLVEQGAIDEQLVASAFMDIVIQQATVQMEELNQSVGLDNVASDLLLTPVYYQVDGPGLPVNDVCPACTIAVMDDDLGTGTYTVTGFSMTYNDIADTVTLNDDGASWFSGMQLPATVANSCSQGVSCYRGMAAGGYAEVYFNYEGRRMIVYDYGVSYTLGTGVQATTHVFPLATAEQVCSLALDNNGSRSLSQTELDEISLRNATGVSCSG